MFAYLHIYYDEQNNKRRCPSVVEQGLWLPNYHRRRSSVNFRRARHFCPKNMYEKLSHCPKFTWFLPENFFKIPKFLWYFPKQLTKFLNFTWFCPKNAQILHNNCTKNIFTEFGERWARALFALRLQSQCELQLDPVTWNVSMTNRINFCLVFYTWSLLFILSGGRTV